MIQTFSDKLTKVIFESGANQESYAIHRYGIEVITATVINFSLIVLFGFLFGHIIESVIYFLSFWFIRKFSGGYHCKTNFRCITSHVSMFLIYLFTFQYFEQKFLVGFIDLAGLILFLIISPINNRNCEETERIKYKWISIVVLCIYIFLSYTTMFTGIFTFVIFVVSIFMLVCIPELWKKSS